MPSNVVPIPSVTPTGKLVQPQGRSFWNRARFRGITPEQLQATLATAERGETEDLADLTQFAYRTDAQVRGVVDTRALAIVGADRVVEPQPGPAGVDELNRRGAEFCFAQLQAHKRIERLISGLAWGEFLGWAGAQHDWQRAAGIWTSMPEPMASRDIKFGSKWERMVRTYQDVSNGEWIDTTDENPARFMWHIPQNSDIPTLDGDVHPVLWPWLFKRWAEINRQAALETGGNPLTYGVVPENADDTIRDNMLEGLENLSAEHRAVFYEGSTPNLMEASHMPGEAFEMAIKAYNREIAKSILGSDLNVEVGESGGNRALGESQFSTTILPRLTSMASRIASTIEEHWFAPLLKFNSHLFGGQTPATPQLRFQLVNEDLPAVDELAVMAGVVSNDELRASKGLEPWGNEVGRARASIQVPEPAEPEPEEDAPTAPELTKVEDENRHPFDRTGLTSPAPSSSAYLKRIKAALSKP